MSPSRPAQEGGPAATAAGQRVVVRLPNWVGDVCMALPALAALQAQGLDLHCFGKAWAGDLLAGLPYRVHRLPKGLFAAAAALRAVGAQRALCLTNSFGSALQLRLAGLRAVGYRKEGARPAARRRGPACHRPARVRVLLAPRPGPAGDRPWAAGGAGAAAPAAVAPRAPAHR